jgi:hypothetical protein
MNNDLIVWVAENPLVFVFVMLMLAFAVGTFAGGSRK